MMRSRWLSTFTLLGILLVILGIVGLALGSRFVYDPGQIPDGNEALCYLVVGGLMLLNGFLSPAASADDDAVVASVPTPKQSVATGADERAAE